MKKYLLLGVGLTLLSCSATKPLPHYSDKEKADQRASIGYWQPEPTKDSTSGPRVEPNSQADFIRRIFAGKPPVVQQDIPGDYIATPDSLRFVKVERQPSWLARLFGHKPQTAIYVGQSSIKAGKKSTITINKVSGDQHNQQVGKKGQFLGDGASNTQTGKKSGDIIKADSGAIVSKAGGPGNSQATRGNNNTPTLTAPVQEASDWKAVLAQPAGEVAAIALGLALVAGFGFLFYAWRKKKALQNLA